MTVSLAKFDVRNFDIAAAYVGMTLRHIASQKVYSVSRVIPARGNSDVAVFVKDAYGRGAFVGTEYIDPDNFVSLHTR